jgi:hypothetical protein
MTTKDARSIATEMLTAWTSGDFVRCRALLHDEATFDGPLGQTRGGDKYIEGVRGFAKTIDRAQIHKTIAEGADVCVVYDLVTKSGTTIPTVGIYRIEADKVHQRPRGAAGGAGAGPRARCRQVARDPPARRAKTLAGARELPAPRNDALVVPAQQIVQHDLVEPGHSADHPVDVHVHVAVHELADRLE